MDADDLRALCQTLDIDDDAAVAGTVRVGGSFASAPTMAFMSFSTDVTPLDSGALELGDTIGEGGMGVVRLARQRALRREVAVKTLKAGREGDAAVTQLLHEALVTGTLEHPNVVPVYALGQGEDGVPVMVMKRVEGVSWLQCIAHPEVAPDFRPDDPLGWHLEVFERVCQAAQFAHSRGIVHRDIKPENVMIGRYGEVYLLDWGVAVTVDEDKREYLVHIEEARGLVGTPAYMAPEMVAETAAAIGPHSDVFLLGATLYHALVGRPPRTGPQVFRILLEALAAKPLDYPTELPEELVAICKQAMETDPAARFSSADDLRHAVQDFRSRRASLVLAHEASDRLAELRRLVASDSPELDGVRIRQLFGECRFGFEQALRVWGANEEARAGLEESIAQLARFEIAAGNLEAAEALVRQLDHPGPLQDHLEALRKELAAREAEVRALEELRRQSDLGTGAKYRTYGAAAACLLLTVMPLYGGWNHRTNGTSQEQFLEDGVVVFVVLSLLIIAFRRGLWANKANQRLAKLIFVFGLSLPLIRYVAWHQNFGIAPTLSIEAAAYSVAYVALGLLSDFSPWFGMLVYACAAIAGLHFEERVFEITSLSNFLAVGWIVLAWSRQRTLE